MNNTGFYQLSSSARAIIPLDLGILAYESDRLVRFNTTYMRNRDASLSDSTFDPKAFLAAYKEQSGDARFTRTMDTILRIATEKRSLETVSKELGEAIFTAQEAIGDYMKSNFGTLLEGVGGYVDGAKERGAAGYQNLKIAPTSSTCTQPAAKPGAALKPRSG
jgi:hypothetical protein